MGLIRVDIGGRRWHLGSGWTACSGGSSRAVLGGCLVPGSESGARPAQVAHGDGHRPGCGRAPAGCGCCPGGGRARGTRTRTCDRGYQCLAWFRCDDAALAIGGVRRTRPRWSRWGALVRGGRRRGRGFVESSAQLDVGARRAGLHAYGGVDNCACTAGRSRVKRRQGAAIDRRRVDADVRAVALSRFRELDADPAWRTALGADPVLAACQVLGQRGGMEIVAPPEWTASQQEDPVRAIARASGVQVRAVTLGHRWWRSAVEPIVAFRESDGSPVALVADRSGVYRMVDPATGIEERVGAEAGQLRPSGFAFYRPLPHGPVTVWSSSGSGLRGVEPIW